MQKSTKEFISGLKFILAIILFQVIIAIVAANVGGLKGCLVCFN